MIESIIRASNILKIDELQLFNLAYEFWYSREAEPRQMNTVFSKYMTKKEAPPWAVHYARSVLRDYKSGNFDPVKFGVQQEVNALPLLCSLIFKIPRNLPSQDDDDVLAA